MYACACGAHWLIIQIKSTICRCICTISRKNRVHRCDQIVGWLAVDGVLSVNVFGINTLHSVTCIARINCQTVSGELPE